MPQEELPPRVRSFLAAHIRTVDELTLLIAVIDSGDRWWDAAAAARELHTSAGSAHRALDRLAQRNLLDIRITGDVRYQYRPGTPELAAGARELAEAYRSHPVAVVQQVTRGARRGIDDFADAFRIRRDDDDR